MQWMPVGPYTDERQIIGGAKIAELLHRSKLVSLPIDRLSDKRLLNIGPVFSSFCVQFPEVNSHRPVYLSATMS